MISMNLMQLNLKLWLFKSIPEKCGTNPETCINCMKYDCIRSWRVLSYLFIFVFFWSMHSIGNAFLFYEKLYMSNFGGGVGNILFSSQIDCPSR